MFVTKLRKIPLVAGIVFVSVLIMQTGITGADNVSAWTKPPGPYKYLKCEIEGVVLEVAYSFAAPLENVASHFILGVISSKDNGSDEDLSGPLRCDDFEGREIGAYRNRSVMFDSNVRQDVYQVGDVVKVLLFREDASTVRGNSYGIDSLNISKITTDKSLLERDFKKEKKYIAGISATTVYAGITGALLLIVIGTFLWRKALTKRRKKR